MFTRRPAWLHTLTSAVIDWVQWAWAPPRLACSGPNTWGVDINPDNCRGTAGGRAPKARGRQPRCRSPRTGCSCAAGGQCRQGAGILFGESGPRRPIWKPGTVVMVSSTIASADAQAIAEALAEYQLLMLDAPVSGGAVESGRRRHDGDGLRERIAAFARLAPVLDAVAGKVYRIGSDIGLGSTVKIIPSAAGRGAHRRCRRSDGACRPRRDPTGDDV
ncbi:NAD(P)-binding domain-containing protein [Klebsiella pneumoniae]|uniref:NAD(P)-binding domain-containing protein n=1 Tax=Klebsiella pneumoniae TaxID=573 RepID=UPI001D0D02FD|nr:NAD(P)-binding domain-containing protein [Klebsiella pneumoniae]